jgi:hypothetical protein
MNNLDLSAGCFLYHAWEAILIGVVGAILVCIFMPLLDRLGGKWMIIVCKKKFIHPS